MVYCVCSYTGAFFSEGNKRIAAYIIVLLQVINILLQRGYYQNTADNTLYYSEVKQDSQRVTYKDFSMWIILKS